MIDWISVKERLPVENQAVIFRYSQNNHHIKGTFEDGASFDRWRWSTGWIRYGRTKEEVAKARTVSFADQDGNNLVPYRWDTFGPSSYWGQEVTHWAPISDIVEDA